MNTASVRQQEKDIYGDESCQEIEHKIVAISKQQDEIQSAHWRRQRTKHMLFFRVHEKKIHARNRSP